jgi:hypothetical protein
MLAAIWRAAIMFYDFYDSERSEATTATDGDTRLAAAPSRWLACAILVNIHFIWGLDFVVLFALASPALLSLHLSTSEASRQILGMEWNGGKTNQQENEKSKKKNQAANPTSRGRILLYTPGSWVIDGRVENQSVVAFDRTSSQSDKTIPRQTVSSLPHCVFFSLYGCPFSVMHCCA